jgi:hypothetical protein
MIPSHPCPEKESLQTMKQHRTSFGADPNPQQL